MRIPRVICSFLVEAPFLCDRASGLPSGHSEIGLVYVPEPEEETRSRSESLPEWIRPAIQPECATTGGFVGTGVRPWTGLRAHPSPADTGPNAFLPSSPTPSPCDPPARVLPTKPPGKNRTRFKRSPRSPRDRRPLPLKRDRASPVFTCGAAGGKKLP